ncbi:MAG: Asp-tRNA(Asn)/Glu-tRNA(Gln) amidotransferase subunit GatC, partial [Gemmatimonadota bacterium]
MAVSRDEVRAVARLARLRLTDEELDRFADQLGAILDHVAALDAATLEDADESGTSRGGRPGAEE